MRHTCLIVYEDQMAAVELETVFELWEKVLPFIPAKDKLEAAETFIKVCDDSGIEQHEIDEFAEGDKILETAVDRYFEEFEDEEEDW